MAKEAYSHISSTLLRQIATFGGELDKFLPRVVKEALEARVRNACATNRRMGRVKRGPPHPVGRPRFTHGCYFWEGEESNRGADL